MHFPGIFFPLCSDEGARPAAEKDVRPAGDHSCQICFEDGRSTAMLPCGHGGLCWDCGLQIYALTEECPMCRTKIEQVSALNATLAIARSHIKRLPFHPLSELDYI